MADEELDAGLVERIQRKIDGGLAPMRVRDTLRAFSKLCGIPVSALNALARGEAVVVPKMPTGDMIEAHQFDCAGDADEAGPARIRSAYAAMLAASPYQQAGATNVNQ